MMIFSTLLPYYFCMSLSERSEKESARNKNVNRNRMLSRLATFRKLRPLGASSDVH